ncbi:MAG TPA: MarR family transcriptional regulator [Burkholderiales bacterium]|nr:MarR family transcriptional regulator [Pseudomonadota bacterium]HVC49494.1 MarR family transcriptional regulator [Burkholderiales bacterium]
MSADIAGLMSRIDEVCNKVADLPRQEIVLTRLIYFLFREMNECFNGKLAVFGLNTTSYVALMNIFASPNGVIHPLELSNAMYSARTNITRLADELVNNGWISRHPCPSDRRKVFLRLTDKGLKLIHQVLPVQSAAMKEVWKSLNASESIEMQELITKVLLNIKSS